MRLTADKPGRYTGKIVLADAHGAKTTAAANRLTAAGSLPNGMKHEAQVLVLNDGGALRAAGGEIAFTRCNSLTLLLAAGTDYVNDGRSKWRGADPHGVLPYWIFAIDTLYHAARKLGGLGPGGKDTPGARRQLRRHMSALRERFEDLWMRRNRRSEIRITLGRYDRAVKAL